VVSDFRHVIVIMTKRPDVEEDDASARRTFGKDVVVKKI
jgi:hypothetical protein